MCETHATEEVTKGDGKSFQESLSELFQFSW